MATSAAKQAQQPRVEAERKARKRATSNIASGGPKDKGASTGLLRAHSIAVASLPNANGVQPQQRQAQLAELDGGSSLSNVDSLRSDASGVSDGSTSASASNRSLPGSSAVETVTTAQPPPIRVQTPSMLSVSPNTEPDLAGGSTLSLGSDAAAPVSALMPALGLTRSASPRSGVHTGIPSGLVPQTSLPIASLQRLTLPPASSEDAKTYEAIGFHPRLVNLGNTCFLNAILQAVAGTRALRDLVLDRFLSEVRSAEEGMQVVRGEQGKGEEAEEREQQAREKLQLVTKLQHHWTQLRAQSVALQICDDEYGRRSLAAEERGAHTTDASPAAKGKGVDAPYEPSMTDLPMTMALLHLLTKMWSVKVPPPPAPLPAAPAPASSTLQHSSSDSSDVAKGTSGNSTPSSPSTAAVFMRKVTPSPAGGSSHVKRNGSNSSLNGVPSPANAVLSPKQLLKSLSRAYEQYSDLEQQDCHEALRLLLDRCRMEEVDLIKKVRPPTEVEGKGEEDKEEIRPQGQEGEEEEEKDDQDPLRPLVDIVFAGKLASMIICQGCGYVSVQYQSSWLLADSVDTGSQVSHTYEDFFDLSLSIRPDVEPKQRKRDRFFRLAERWSRRASTPSNNTVAAGTSFTASTAAAVRAGVSGATTPVVSITPFGVHPPASFTSSHPQPLARPSSAFDARSVKHGGIAPFNAGLGKGLPPDRPVTPGAPHDVSQHTEELTLSPTSKTKPWAAWTPFGSSADPAAQRRRRMSADAVASHSATDAAGGDDEEQVPRFFGFRRQSQRRSKKKTAAAVKGMESGTEPEMATMALAPVPVRSAALDFSGLGVGSDDDEHSDYDATAIALPQNSTGKQREAHLRLLPTRKPEESVNLVSKLESALNRNGSISTSRGPSPAPHAVAGERISRPSSSARNTPDHVAFKESKRGSAAGSSSGRSAQQIAPHLLYIARILSNAPSVAPLPAQILAARAAISGWSRHFESRTPVTVTDVIAAAAMAAQKSHAAGAHPILDKTWAQHSEPQSTLTAVQAAQQSTGLVAALNQFTSTELLDEENAFKCKRCWRIEHEKRTGEEYVSPKRRRATTLSSASSLDSSDSSQASEVEVEEHEPDVPAVSTSPPCPPSMAAHGGADLESYQPHPPLQRIDSQTEPNTPSIEMTLEQAQPMQLQPSTTSTSSAVSGSATSGKKRVKQTVARSALKRYLIAEPPPVLVIQFKRFQSTSLFKTSQSFKKVDDMVTFPEFLDIGPWLAPPREEYDRHGALKASSDPRAVREAAERTQRDLDAQRGRSSAKNGWSKKDRWMWRSRSPNHHKAGHEDRNADTAVYVGEGEATLELLPPPSSQYRLYAVVVQ